MAGARWPAGTVPRHRATTAQLGSLYPFAAADGLGTDGVFLGINRSAGGSAFAFDPFVAYRAGLVTNPNIVIAGDLGVGKSATAKCFVYRAVGVFGRWVAIADPKGEYEPLGCALGLTVLKLHPGGTTRLNPLDPSALGAGGEREAMVDHQATMVAALAGCVLGRPLTPIEDAALSWAVAQLADRGASTGQPTLADLARLLADPPDELASRAGMSAAELARRAEGVRLAVGKLVDRTLRGMFDGPTTARLDTAGPGVVIDLSAVRHDPDALTLVLVATTGWLQAQLARTEGPPRLQVLDEAWNVLASERTARFLQGCWKLARSQGVANVAIVHRLSDLAAQADDGTATAKLAAGLLADTQTRVVFRQAPDQLADARALLGLSATETAVVAGLSRGEALWKVRDRTARVAHVLSKRELALANSDSRMGL